MATCKKLETKLHPNLSKVLCLDLGLRNIGWSIFKYGLLGEYGVITNPKGRAGQSKCVQEICNFQNVASELRVKAGQVDFVCAEVLYTSQSQSGAIAVGFSWATVSFLRAYRDVNVILPKQLKQLVKPKGKVSKQQVANFVYSKHPELLFKKLPDHITDAIAVYYAYEKEVSNH